MGLTKPKVNSAPGARDICQTPPYAVLPIVEYLRGRIWEPACGEGYIAAALRAMGFDVVCSDIDRGQDFFCFTPAGGFDMIVTNPPFSTKYKWLEECYNRGKPFALLMPVEVLGARSAQVLFEKNGVEIIFTSQRIDFKMPNRGWDSSAWFPVAWYTHGLGVGREITYADVGAKRIWKRLVSGGNDDVYEFVKVVTNDKSDSD